MNCRRSRSRSGGHSDQHLSRLERIIAVLRLQSSLISRRLAAVAVVAELIRNHNYYHSSFAILGRN